MTSVIEEITAERRRQVEVEGWTSEHDDQHSNGSLAQAASCYAHPIYSIIPDSKIPMHWPRSWATKWWKPKTRRYNLIRAAALIIAEIERLDRQ